MTDQERRVARGGLLLTGLRALAGLALALAVLAVSIGFLNERPWSSGVAASGASLPAADVAEPDGVDSSPRRVEPSNEASDRAPVRRSEPRAVVDASAAPVEWSEHTSKKKKKNKGERRRKRERRERHRGE
jgi:hypothetical protein